MGASMMHTCRSAALACQHAHATDPWFIAYVIRCLPRAFSHSDWCHDSPCNLKLQQSLSKLLLWASR